LQNSPFGLLASPLSNIELMSPESTLSFSLSSPPPQNNPKAVDTHPRDILSTNISPSIFSPDGFGGAAKYLTREKELNFANVHLFDESNRLLFSKDPLERRPAKLDYGAAPERMPSPIKSITTTKTLSMKTRKGSKASESDSLAASSPHGDLARRLSLESHSESIINGNLKLVTKSTPTHGKKISIPSLTAKNTPTRTTCNCKKSRCLKLYCDCFAILKFCDSTYCNCFQCCNNPDNEDKRSEAIKSTKEKNLLAFSTKISDKEQHVTGCHCKNSHCLKKYCECFTGNALCGSNCKCQSCKNYEGSVELLKTREASPRLDGSAKKRKESPNSVNFIEESSPTQHISLEENTLERRSSYSLRTSTKESQKRYTVEKVNPESSSKRRKVKFATSTPIIYPFFGEELPETPKLIALKCLDFLSGKDIYTMSQVNSLWNKAAFDEALWE
jgi:hypothetical protein